MGDNNIIHPLIIALGQTSRQIQFMLFDIMDDLTPETVSTVEYLPILSNKSYFVGRKTPQLYLSKIIIETYQEVLISQNIVR